MVETEQEMCDPPKYIVGIDAANLLMGGGRTHLIELLAAAEPQKFGIKKIIVWGRRSTLVLIKDSEWLHKVYVPALEDGLLRRSMWQKFKLSAAARSAGCDVLFVPGGSFSGDFRPVVTMSRNMLPFEWRELCRYGFSFLTLKLLLLRLVQSRSFRSANGLIFLSQYAYQKVSDVCGHLNKDVTIIPHGVNARFLSPPRQQRLISDCSADAPFRLLYVSNIDMYKHQWMVVEAVARLRTTHGWPVTLELVGASHPKALKKLKSSIQRWDQEQQWVSWKGEIPYTQLEQLYQSADVGVFASSCENMPNILMETMAAGLPVACSNKGPMPEFLKSDGLYFDPEDSVSIAQVLEELIESPGLRSRLAAASWSSVAKLSWKRCADETIKFLNTVVSKKAT